MNTTAPQINLLTKRKKEFTLQSATALRAKIWSGTVLVIYLVVLVLFVAVNIYFSQQVKTTQEALDRAKMTISAKAVVIQQQERVVVRAKTIESLMSDRRESIKLWQQLRLILPEGTELSSFSLEKNTLRASVEAPNVLFANAVVDMIQKDVASLGADKTILNLARSEDGSYKLDMELTLNSTGKSKKS